MAKHYSVYMVDRAYGGPEEGGWYFDYGVPHRSLVPKNKKSARILFSALSTYRRRLNEGRADISSVLSEGQFIVRVEDSPPQVWPSTRPHYC